MGRQLKIILSLFCFVPQLLFVQQVFCQKNLLDTAVLDDVVVTATRTERKLSNVAIPTTIVSNKVIQLSGSLRLNDILQEQSGILLTSGTGSNAVGGGIFGNGIQMQGLSPDHTIILIDGEPIIGRQGGVVDLSRFAIGNIQKIEIVKGPSSSLYGSEAMAGVVNIITKPLQENKIQASARIGSFNTNDLVLSGNYTHKKLGLYIFSNRNSSNGYDLNTATPEKTQDAFYSYTNQVKIGYTFSNKTKLIVSARQYYSKQNSNYAINSPTINIGGNGIINDYNINPVLFHNFLPTIKNQLRLYASSYSFVQNLDSLKNGKVYYKDDFTQTFSRIENHTDVNLSKQHTLTIGAGFTSQRVNTSRYKQQQQQQALHAFIQHEWLVKNYLTIISGLRYDYNNAFTPRLSPKLSISYKPNAKIQVHSSFGAGFKAPDFRQLYLNFTNSAGDGYSIFGANELSIADLQIQKNNGLIAAILPAAYQITTLKPETSTGFNVGAKIKANTLLTIDVNLFRNDIDNLINYLPIAINNNGTSVFSYVNINRSYTQGAELNLQYQATKNLQVSGGYQFLLTADKDILHNIQDGKIYGRNEPNGSARLLSTADYSGLLGRSKHMANIKVFYEAVKTGWAASVRATYRSKWGVVDKDGNGFANMEAEFASSFLQVNATVSKKINQQFQAQVGLNNITNQTNAQFMPNAAGINWFLTLNYSFKK
jgi:outer membrane receptor for ferrienterochelin and colicins